MRTAPSSNVLVSVVMPVYNGSAFLADSIRSILTQSHTCLELIVVDDGSTDDSLAVVESTANGDDRVRVSAGHHGAQRARNLGVSAARGELIAHIDQDNIALPPRIAAQIAWMRQHLLDVCGSCTWVFGDREHLKWVPERHGDIRIEFLFQTAMVHSTILMDAAVAKAHPFDERAAYGGFELLTRLTWSHRVGNVPQVLLKYREHRAQHTRALPDVMRGDRQRYRERHFFALFPDSSSRDYAAVAKVADAAPFDDDAERDLAEVWMTRLADRVACPFLRGQLHDRRRHALAQAS